MPGEAGGHPDGDDLHAAPPISLLHQHAARPHLPLYLPAAAAGIAAVAATAAVAALGGTPPEELLGGAPQLHHLRI